MDDSMKENISLWQLFILILLFNLGSSIVLNLGTEAKNNAWISILIACAAGLLLVFIYYQLLSWYPKQNLFEIIEACFGKWLGRLFSTLYIVNFFLLASFVLRDFGELMVSTIYTRTPIEFIHLTMIIVILYILTLGIEVLGRAAEIFIPYALLFLLFVGLGIIFSGEFDIENLFPILGDGLMPVLKPVYPVLLNFPFGEFITFMVIIPYVSNIRYARKVGISAYLLSGIILAYSAILQIAALGILKDRANFPLLSAAREISLLHFIERIDLLIVFIMMLGIVVKVSVLFYGGLKGLEHIFRLPYRSFGFPMAMIVSLFSISIGEDYPSYFEKGVIFIPNYFQTPLNMIIPLLLLTIAFIKKKMGLVNKNESI
ncbi:GerAB/ArcD/ProY family transporter [Bacillus sp. CGMCC 1.16607]|uniref:GerAB/ArcD/ProY family transporter n=1 Tax=Bacillus sp. CGMCC 1.16607 TaxID=3351842 RepID=UPI00363E860C